MRGETLTFPLRNLRGLRDPGEAPEEADAVLGPGLPPELHVRRHQLGQLPHQAGGGAWTVDYFMRRFTPERL